MSEKQYFHELTDDEIDELYKEHVTLGYIVATFRQPDWCSYHEALYGQLGCWALMHIGYKQERVSETFCRTCERFKKRESHEESKEQTLAGTEEKTEVH